MTYVDGIITPVPEGKRAEYVELARAVGPIFKEYGALHVADHWGNDVPHGKATDFYKATEAQDGETVVFSWIVWESKAARDTAWGKVMEDARMKSLPSHPFDGKRMFYGGFETVYDSEAK